MSESVFTVEELADRWKCSRDVLYDMLRQKELRSFRIGNSYRISAAEVHRHESGEV